MKLTRFALSLLALSLLGACAGVPSHPPQSTGVAPPIAETPAPTGEPRLSQDIQDQEAAIGAPDASSPQTAATADAATEDAATDAPVHLATSPAIPAPPADLWQRIRDGFALPEIDTPLVRDNEEWYAQRPDYVQRMVERSKRYLYYVVHEVEKRGMPTEIALLPMVESAYNPKAYSRSHASGIWQFTADTGRHYGLQQNWWYDGRRDILAATDAALDYLENLHKMFGSWDLALAAYNWGEGAVSRAIARNQARGEPTDYLSLRLPTETRNYVPRLIALKNIVTDPGKFGLRLASIPNHPYFTTVTVDRPVDVKVAARLAEVPVSEFVSLNPAYNRPVVTSPGGATLLLPVEKADTFNENLESYSDALVSWRSYTATRRERLERIAHHFGIGLARLREINDISPRKRLAARGETLLVPTLGHKAGTREAAADFRPTVQERFASSREIRHIVKKGETLFGIARHHRVTTAQIKAWNGLKSNHIARGQRLVIRIAASGKHEPLVAKNRHQERKRTLYTVRRGDTLHSIARRFKVAVNDIQRWNNLHRGHTLHPGQRVTVYL